MRTGIILFFLVFCALSLKAQNYSPIVDGNVSFFTGSDSYIVALKVLSKQDLTNKTEYQLNTVWDLSNTRCISTAGIAWHGSKCTKESEVFSFYNKNNEPLKTYPLATINTTWTAYTYSNTDVLIGKVAKIEKKTFLGLEDDVKTIVFERQTSVGSAVNDVANSASLEISKNYGLVKAFDFATFPTATSQKILSGTTSPALGKTYLTNKEIYSFEVGDEFHYDILDYNPNLYTSSIKQIKKVLNKVLTDTELIYTFEVKQGKTYKNFTTNQETYTITVDKTVEKYSTETTFYVPNEIIMNGNSGKEGATIQNDFNNRRTLYPSSIWTNKSGNCWIMMLIDGLAWESYTEGLGLFKTENSFALFYSKTMVYYKKGLEIWGTPLIVSGIENQTQTAFKIYPNPLNKDGLLSISSDNQRIAKVEVFNLCGISVYQNSKMNDNNAVLNLSHLPQGSYWLQITDIKGNKAVQKIIK